MDYRFRTWMLGAALLAALPAFAGSTIYRCHALNGALLFQDRPCNQVPGTREAQAGQEGEVVPPAPPPAEDGGTASGRYTRLIDEADRQQRAQAEADAAEARRLRAERAAAAPPQIAIPSTPECRSYGANGDCLDAFYPAYGVYPVPAPPQQQRPPPPSPAPAPAPGRRPPVSAADAAAKATRDLMAIP